jgi:hypothetical protein
VKLLLGEGGEGAGMGDVQEEPFAVCQCLHHSTCRASESLSMWLPARAVRGAVRGAVSNQKKPLQLATLPLVAATRASALLCCVVVVQGAGTGLLRYYLLRNYSLGSREARASMACGAVCWLVCSVCCRHDGRPVLRAMMMMHLCAPSHTTHGVQASQADPLEAGVV